MHIEPPAFLARNLRLALFAQLATASSAFGQTYFLGLFGDRVRTAFDLGHSHYGLVYAVATLCSAVLLLRFGGLTDRWGLRRQSLLAVGLLAAGCLVLSGAAHIAMLWLGFLLVRFGGQAMLSHVGMTAAGRYFGHDRGKAVAFAATGYPLSEALLPLAATAMMLWLGWRGTWLSSSIVLVLIVLPLMLWLCRDVEHPQTHAARMPAATRGATRHQVMHDAGFYLLLPAVLAGPFIVTALLFHQGELARLKGWPGDIFAAAFVAYGIGHLSSLTFAGSVIDRIGAQRALPLSLLPMLFGLLYLSFYSANWVPWVFLGLLGFSQGALNASVGAIWPERYGVAHIGSIRSVAQTLMVISTAAAPILVGVLFDLGAPAGAVVFGLATLTLASALLVFAAGSTTHQRRE